jgi:hypothetical protein
MFEIKEQDFNWQISRTKIKTVAVAIRTGAALNESSGSYSTKIIQLLLYNT